MTNEIIILKRKERFAKLTPLEQLAYEMANYEIHCASYDDPRCESNQDPNQVFYHKMRNLPYFSIRLFGPIMTASGLLLTIMGYIWRQIILEKEATEMRKIMRLQVMDEKIEKIGDQSKGIKGLYDVVMDQVDFKYHANCSHEKTVIANKLCNLGYRNAFDGNKRSRRGSRCDEMK